MKTKYFLIYAVLLFVGSSLWAKDISRLFIRVHTNDIKTPLRVFVTDPLGRTTGGDSTQKTFFREIPNSGYGTEATDYEEGGSGPESFLVELIQLESSGTYKVVVESNKAIDYGLSVRYSDRAGNRSYNKFKGLIEPGKPKEYLLEVDPTPGAGPVKIKKVVTFQTLEEDLSLAREMGIIKGQEFYEELWEALLDAKQAQKKRDSEEAREELGELAEELKPLGSKRLRKGETQNQWSARQSFVQGFQEDIQTLKKHFPKEGRDEEEEDEDD